MQDINMRLFGFILLLQGISVSLTLMYKSTKSMLLDHDLTNLVNLPTHTHVKSKLPKKVSVWQPISDRRETNNNFVEYGEHLKKLGAEILKDSGKKMMKQMKIVDKMSKKINSVVNDYTDMLQHYFDFMATSYGTKAGFFIDTEFMFLNMLQMAWELLYHKKWEIVRTANSEIESTTEFINGIPIISKLIKKRNMNERKLEMKHICNAYKVCKPYPAFTDYFEDFLLQLLSLSDRKLKEPVYHIIKTLPNNDDLLTILDGVKHKELLILNVKSLYTDTSIKELLTKIRTMIYNRYKYHSTQDVDEKNREQALRSILNIINEAFRNVSIVDDFEATIKAIKTWGNGAMSKLVIERVVAKIFRTIKEFQSPIFDDLIETMVTGKQGIVWFVQGYNGVYI